MQKTSRPVWLASTASVQIASIVLLLAFLAIAVQAQTTTDGATPLAISPGAPEGAYGLSGFDHINLFNGGLNFALPLHGVGGRGGAYYTMTLPIEQKWSVQRTYDQYETYRYSLANWWTGLKPGYGPGVVQARQSGSQVATCTYFMNGHQYRQTVITIRR